ncbi:sugar ABC transporter substrate-binding protein [soil metagenome]
MSGIRRGIPSRVKLVVAIAAIGTFGAIITGCAPAEEPADGPIELSYWFQSGTPESEEVLVSEIQRCAAEQDEVSVTTESVALDTMYPRLATALKDDEMPNVLTTVESVAAFLHDKNVLVPVDDVIDEHGREDFIPSFLTVVSADDQTWAVPDWALHHAIWYRKDLFAAAGVTTLPTTWDELAEVSAKLTVDTNGDGTIDQYGFGVPWGAKFFGAQQSLFDVLYARGVTVFDPETGDYVFGDQLDEATEALQYMLDLYHSSSPEASIDWSLVDIRPALLNGQIAAGPEWGGVVKQAQTERPELLPELGVFPFPGERGAAVASLGGGFFQMISDGDAREVDASKALVSCLLDPESVALRSGARAPFALPATLSAYEADAFLDNEIVQQFSPEIATIRDEVIDSWQRYGLEAGLNPVSSVMESTSVINELMQKAALGQIDAREAIDQLNDFLLEQVG